MFWGPLLASSGQAAMTGTSHDLSYSASPHRLPSGSTQKRALQKLLPGTWGSSPGRASCCTQVSQVGERAQVAQSCEPSATWCVPELAAFHSFRQYLSDTSSWIGCPRPFFPGSHTWIWKCRAVKTCPWDTGPFHRQSMALGIQFPTVSSALVCHRHTPGRKGHPPSPPSLLQPT